MLPQRLLIYLPLLYASTISSAQSTSDFLETIIHDQRASAPEGFTLHRPANLTQIIRLRIGLRQNNISGLHDTLLDVSTPGKPRYGKHLTVDQVSAYTAPKPDTISLVNQWLTSNGISSTPISPAGDWLQFSVPIHQANNLIGANYQVFKHDKTGTEFVRTLLYSIPKSLQEHIDTIHPTTTFDSPFAHLPLLSVSPPTALKARKSGQACTTEVTPACIEALYGFPSPVTSQSTSSLAVSGFVDQIPSTDDLSSFLKKFRPDVPSNATFTLETLDGKSGTELSPSMEANLYIQYTLGLSTNVPTVFISTGNNSQDGALDGLLDTINFVLAQSNPPHILTTSYGQNEDTISRSLATSLCNAYAQLGARGISILCSSGDGGVSGWQAGQCTSFIPTFPSGCPFITSVGATMNMPIEIAAPFSSGGFSNYFTTPSYQSSAVQAYLNALGSTNKGLFNTTGRAYPDVSAQGQSIAIVDGGNTRIVSGTSGSNPIFASIIALLNADLVGGDLPPLGFLNPLLYSAGGQAALTDITVGNNPGCDTTGFPAKSGWDAVTGLGTPNFSRLLDAIQIGSPIFFNYIPTSMF